MSAEPSDVKEESQQLAAPDTEEQLAAPDAEEQQLTPADGASGYSAALYGAEADAARARAEALKVELAAAAEAAAQPRVLSAEESARQTEALDNLQPLSADATALRQSWRTAIFGHWNRDWPNDAAAQPPAFINFFESERVAHVYVPPTSPLPELHRDALHCIMQFLPMQRLMFAATFSHAWLAAVRSIPLASRPVDDGGEGNTAGLCLLAGVPVARKLVRSYTLANARESVSTELLTNAALHALGRCHSLRHLCVLVSVHAPALDTALTLPATLERLQLDVTSLQTSTATSYSSDRAVQDKALFSEMVAGVVVPLLAGLARLQRFALHVDNCRPWDSLIPPPGQIIEVLATLPNLIGFVYGHLTNPDQHEGEWGDEQFVPLRRCASILTLTRNMWTETELQQLVYGDEDQHDSVGEEDDTSSCMPTLRATSLQNTRIASDDTLVGLARLVGLELFNPLSIACPDLSPLGRLLCLQTVHLRCEESVQLATLIAALAQLELGDLTLGHPELTSRDLGEILSAQPFIDCLSLDQCPSLESLSCFADCAESLSRRLLSLSLWSCPLLVISDLSPLLCLTFLVRLSIRALGEELPESDPDDAGGGRLEAAFGPGALNKLQFLDSFIAE